MVSSKLSMLMLMLQVFLGPTGNRFLATRASIVARSPERAATPSPERLGFATRVHAPQINSEDSNATFAEPCEGERNLAAEGSATTATNTRPTTRAAQRAPPRTAPAPFHCTLRHSKPGALFRETYTSEPRSRARKRHQKDYSAAGQSESRARSGGRAYQPPHTASAPGRRGASLRRALVGTAAGTDQSQNVVHTKGTVYPAEACLAELLQQWGPRNHSADDDLDMAADALVWNVDCAYRTLQREPSMTPMSSLRNE